MSRVRVQVMCKLLRREELPWEGVFAEKKPAARRQPGRIRKAVLSLMHRKQPPPACVTGLPRSLTQLQVN